MNKQEIFEHSITSGNDKLYFKFIGILQDSINYESLNERIRNCFSTKTLANNIETTISWVRTIFKSFKEIYLEVELYIKDDISEKIIYKENIIDTYQKVLEDQITINYNKDNKPDLSLSITDLDLTDYLNYKIKNEIINNEIKYLYSLTKINEIELTSDDKALCLFYKTFYGEYPDFSSKDINIKMQTMMSILTDFGICLDDSYSFRLNSKQFPVSINLSKTIKKLTPIGKIENMDNSVRLDEILEQDIKTIGNTIKKYISGTTNELDALKRISTIFHSGKNCLPTNAAIDTISEFCKIPVEEVESSLKLVKKIKKRIYE